MAGAIAAILQLPEEEEVTAPRRTNPGGPHSKGVERMKPHGVLSAEVMEFSLDLLLSCVLLCVLLKTQPIEKRRQVLKRREGGPGRGRSPQQC